MRIADDSKAPQAVFKQFGGGGYGSSDSVFSDAAEYQQHQKLEKLYISTRAAKVAEPLRAMVMGAPLEDARHLAQRYDRVRQEAEAQAIEVSKRQIKVRETVGGGDNISKLEAAEAKLQELKSNMAVLGKESVAAMTAVEAQQQRLTLQRLIAMVESERTYHQKVLQILEQLEAEMLSERQRIEASPSPVSENFMPPPPSYEEANGMFTNSTVDGIAESVEYFLAEVIHSYQAETDVELNLSVGDYVIVRKSCTARYGVKTLASLGNRQSACQEALRLLSNNGWAEGECKGKAGWFPSAYVERRERVLASDEYAINAPKIPKGGFTHHVDKMKQSMLIPSTT
ncbi:src domain protein 3 [Musa troglodytarum]|uniref:Src domain protein 3 n=1 Tax=Musa troglodytarum TaxID=320322 RepID=A0A9E7FXF4_9LILI|nr:src domain protein 3 [Musa troglodytarum]